MHKTLWNLLCYILNLNDKGPSLNRVCFPKSYSPLANWPWLRISPQSSFMLSIVWSLLPDNDWWALLVFLCKLNPIKAHWGKSSWPFSFERSATFPCQADHVLVDLFSSLVAGGALWAEPPQSRCALYTSSYMLCSLKKHHLLISVCEADIARKYTSLPRYWFENVDYF